MSIDNPREVPEQWRAYFEKREIGFTYRALDRKVEGVGLNTIVRALSGQGKATDKTVAAITKALGMTPEKFHELRGVPVTEPFYLPARASQLNQRERDAVMGVVNALLAAKEQQPHAQLNNSSNPPAATPGAQGPEDQEVEAAVAKMSDDELRAAAAADPMWADYIRTRHPQRVADDWDF